MKDNNLIKSIKDKSLPFFKSNVFIIAIIGLTWFVWGKAKWGVIPFAGFILSYFLLFWRIYIWVEDLNEYRKDIIKKSSYLFIPSLIGSCLIGWIEVDVGGYALIVFSLILIIWKLPEYLVLYLKNGDNNGTCSATFAKQSVFRRLIGLFIIIFILLKMYYPLYIQNKYEHAVSRLNKGSHSIQITAIHDLETLARKNDNYRRRIIQILSSTAREIAPVKINKKKVPQIINAKRIAYLLGSLQKDKNKIYEPIDLRSTDLKRTNLQNLNFSHANFNNADLSKADFCKSDLKRINAARAKFNKAKMCFVNASSANFHLTKGINVDFRQSNLQGAHFNWSNWEGSNFFLCKLQDAIIKGNSFNNVSLRRANMEGVYAISAGFKHTNLNKAVLDEGNFQDAQFIEADLRQVSLKKANLIKANFQNANLRGADLRWANIKGADFSGADLRGVKGLTKKMLSQIQIDEHTKLDENLQKMINDLQSNDENEG